MKYLHHAIRTLWWFAAAYVPVAQFRFYKSYWSAIGCPISGDCYVPGSEHLYGMEWLIVSSAAVLWPLCLWYLFIKPWRTSHLSAQPAAQADAVATGAGAA